MGENDASDSPIRDRTEINVKHDGDNFGQMFGANYGTVNVGAQVDNCLTDLFLTDSRDDKIRINDTKGGLLNGSCDWILKYDAFHKWHDDGAIRLLWIKGDPGKGNTMLTIGIIGELERRIQALNEEDGKKAFLCYYFFEGTNSDRNNAVSMLRALIWSLIDQKETFRTALGKGYEKYGSKLFTNLNAFNSLSEILGNILKEASPATVYIVVDALDECRLNIERTLSFIDRHSSHPHVKWIVSSRNEGQVEKHLQPQPSRIPLSLEENDAAVLENVNEYIDQRLGNLGALKNNSSLRPKVRHIMRQKAEGTFLWVAIAIEELQDVEDVLFAMEEMRSGLQGCKGIYSQMMERIEKLHNNKECLYTLSTVILAYRPLHKLELRMLLEFLDGAPELGEAIERTLRKCGSYLTLRNDRVYIIHQSAKDYLNSVLFPSGPTATHRLILRAAVNAMAQILRENVYDVPKLDNFPQYGLGIDEIPIPDPDPLLPSHYRDLTLLSLAVETSQFLSYFHSLIKEAPLQLYVSAHIFTPTNSRIRSLSGFRDCGPQWILSWGNVSKNWTQARWKFGKLTSPPEGVAYSHDWTMMAIHSHGKVGIFDIITGEMISYRRFGRFEADSFFNAILALSNDKKVLAMCGVRTDYKSVEIWDVETLADDVAVLMHPSSVTAMAFSSTGKHFTTASANGSVQVWDTNTWKQAFKYSHGEWVSSVSFSPDGALVASGSADQTIILYDVTTGATVRTLHQSVASPWALRWIRKHEVLAICFSLDGKTISSVSNHGGGVVWEVATGEITHRFTAWDYSSLEKAEYAVFSADCGLVALYRRDSELSRDGTISVWESSSSRRRYSDDAGDRRGPDFTFSPNASLLVHDGADAWDLSEYQPSSSSSRRLPRSAGAVKFSADGSSLVSVERRDYHEEGTEDRVTLWDIATWVQKVDLPANGVCSVTFLVDGSVLYSWKPESPWIDRKHQIIDSQIRQAREISDPTQFERHALEARDATLPCRSTYEIDPSCWIMRNGQRALWLPPRYRPSHVDSVAWSPMKEDLNVQVVAYNPAFAPAQDYPSVFGIPPNRHRTNAKMDFLQRHAVVPLRPLFDQLGDFVVPYQDLLVQWFLWLFMVVFILWFLLRIWEMIVFCMAWALIRGILS
ncbi:hypothetical protein B0J13DRAFT_676836 [Dactylonectria estremocensis]|uniref:Nephrocystin 3-like N-terminal domain-containing protein n=1 Tax=Dactylonectria estremocensis TaxID=1079267 RepID=A0A9P9J189_9HYPO|nr:hypothetical protein B0J13DRAFT_676836 [Dactylonectria estremocensis]